MEAAQRPCPTHRVGVAERRGVRWQNPNGVATPLWSALQAHEDEENQKAVPPRILSAPGPGDSESGVAGAGLRRAPLPPHCFAALTPAGQPTAGYLRCAPIPGRCRAAPARPEVAEGLGRRPGRLGAGQMCPRGRSSPPNSPASSTVVATQVAPTLPPTPDRPTKIEAGTPETLFCLTGSTHRTLAVAFS